MPQDTDDPVITTKPRSMAQLILRDIHFWIPVVVLIGGLAVLHWIS
jgi:hypothetical protein